ncbi:polysaccharide deacetylase family protein [Pedobacter sp. L105]|uniref:polysaccharide deacetylase family protein n=1 Tax=Pedobacter sp. L105 TaxID=1641871 RepID=UPI00131C625B|nr:polysaccharide deacetylase family protein [Pedobacter sp. L105]
MQTRKDFIKNAAIAGAGALMLPNLLSAQPTTQTTKEQPMKNSKWPDGTRLVISATMIMEAGGQPDVGFDSPFPKNLENGFKDLPATTWFNYGYKEGIPRLLDLWDKHGVKVTSHVIGQAALKSPDLVREIVKRGHEVSGHGQTWSPQYTLSYDEEKAFMKKAQDTIKEVCGVTTVGYNCNWLRRSPNTAPIVQELGGYYHTDDLSRDEPFLIPINGKNFAVVPYTLRCNDIQLIAGQFFTSTQFLETLKLEFDQMYKESANRKLMMSFSAHDRISGTPQQINVIDQFITYALQHEGVKFMRKDDIAKMTLADKNALVDTDFV